MRRLALGIRQRLARLAAPCEDLLWRKPMPARDLRDNGARHKRLFNNPRLEVLGELAPPPSPGNHFQPANRRYLRLKLMVKRRHKPISHSEIDTIADHGAQKKVGSKQRLRCTTGKERRITRWEHEHVLEAAQKRLDQNPQAMRVRRETVEHPFGTLKMRMGATHFLMKRLPKVATEMALHVLAYNVTRVMNIVGIQPLIAAIRA